jgi:predicted HicB family RNase H-like nuclease
MAKPTNKDHDLTVRVPKTLTKELKNLALKENNSMSSIVRRVLSDAVREDKEKNKPK